MRIHAITFPDWISDTAFSLGPLSVKWYGLSYIAGIILAYLYAKRTINKKHLWQVKNADKQAIVPNKTMLEDLMFFSLIGIILGGRIGYTLFYNLSDFLQNPLDIFKIWQGGMSFHGGFIGVCLAAVFMAKTRKIPLMRIADILAISAPIGIFLVRLANFVNQELYGRATDVPWAVIFSPNGYPLAPRHPSQLYEAFLEGVVIFVVLWFASRKLKILTKPGIATSMFLIMYGLFRFLVEYVREPDYGIEQFGFLTRGQTYSLPMLIAGILLFLWAKRRNRVAPIWPEPKAKRGQS